jgi:hypothetical protein
MGGENTYFIFSVIAEIICIQIVAYLVFIRIRRKSITDKHKPGSLEYRNYQKLIRPIVLVVAAIATLFSTANLIHITRNILHVTSERSILVFGPVACVALYMILLLIAYKTFRTGEGNKRSS